MIIDSDTFYIKQTCENGICYLVSFLPEILANQTAPESGSKETSWNSFEIGNYSAENLSC